MHRSRDSYEWAVRALGISGMRERAHNIGGQLNIWSNHGAGTEVELVISPASHIERCNTAPLDVVEAHRKWGEVTAMVVGNKIRIFIVDDHPLLREGIAAVIERQDDMVLVGEATNGQEAVEGSVRIGQMLRLWICKCRDGWH